MVSHKFCMSYNGMKIHHSTHTEKQPKLLGANTKGLLLHQLRHPIVTENPFKDSLDALSVNETWLTGDNSNQKTVTDVIPVDYSPQHVAHTHRKGIQNNSCFQARSSENHQLTYVWGVIVWVAIVY